MSELVDPNEIAEIVGCQRHRSRHIGRYITAGHLLYILHPHKCLEKYDDLRECPYSIAMDRGINRVRDWQECEDKPVLLSIKDMQLVPISFSKSMLRDRRSR